MPSNKEHARLSKARTGKSFIELHEWMNEDYNNPKINPKRHDIAHIQQNIEIVKEKFGNEAVKEFLYHIKEDYEKNKAYKIIKLLSKVKRALFLPLTLLKNKQEA